MKKIAQSLVVSKNRRIPFIALFKFFVDFVDFDNTESEVIENIYL
jgi:hypothetical protein